MHRVQDEVVVSQPQVGVYGLAVDGDLAGLDRGLVVRRGLGLELGCG